MEAAEEPFSRGSRRISTLQDTSTGNKWLAAAARATTRTSEGDMAAESGAEREAEDAEKACSA